MQDVNGRTAGCTVLAVFRLPVKRFVPLKRAETSRAKTGKIEKKCT